MALPHAHGLHVDIGAVSGVRTNMVELARILEKCTFDGEPQLRVLWGATFVLAHARDLPTDDDALSTIPGATALHVLRNYVVSESPLLSFATESDRARCRAILEDLFARSRGSRGGADGDVSAMEPRSVVTRDTYDVLVTDIHDEDFDDIARDLGVGPRLSAAPTDGVFPVAGIVWGVNNRVFLPLVVSKARGVSRGAFSSSSSWIRARPRPTCGRTRWRASPGSRTARPCRPARTRRCTA